jgi:hypothetical protein
MADLINRFLVFLKQLIDDISIKKRKNRDNETETDNVSAADVNDNSISPFVGVSERQLSTAGDSSYKLIASQIDGSYPANTDYCVFILEYVQNLATVYQLLFDSRPYYLKVKALTVAKNIFFSALIRYLHGSLPENTSLIAAGVIDSNNDRLQENTGKHIDGYVAKHVLFGNPDGREDGLIDPESSYYLFNEFLKTLTKLSRRPEPDPIPAHVLIDFRTQGIYENDQIVVTTVAAGNGQFWHATGPACQGNRQTFIEFLNLLGVHGTPKRILLEDARKKYQEINGTEMPAEFEGFIDDYNKILDNMKQNLKRQFRRYAYDICINNEITPDMRAKKEEVKHRMEQDAAITIIDGIITINKDDLKNRDYMLANLDATFGDWRDIDVNLPDRLIGVRAPPVNMFEIEWPKTFDLINWSLIDPNPNINFKLRKNPKEYMVYVTTTIGSQGQGMIPFEDLQILFDCMIESQKNSGINAFKAGGKHKRSRSNRKKQRNTKKKQNKQNKLRKGRKTNKRKQNKRRSRKIR